MTKTAQAVIKTIRATEHTVRATSGFVGFVWRHRVGLGPVLVGFAVMSTALMMGWLIESPLIAYGSILLGTAIAGIGIYFGISDREGKLHARRERVHLYMVTAVTSALLIMYHRFVLPGVVEWKTALLTWFWSMIVLGAPWWWNLRRRSRVSLENDLDAWPIVSDGTKLAKTWWSGFTKTSTGWTGLLHLPPQLSRRSVLTDSELIEGLTNAPADSITIEPAGRNSNLVRVTCIENDPHSDAIEWDGRSLRSITEVALLGKYADGSLGRTSWWKNGSGGYHRLMGGVTRSGKSGLMHLLCALYGPCDDVVMWGIDLKGGTALLPWAPMFDWIATTVEEAKDMVLAAEQLVDARAATLGRRGKEVITPSRDMPVVLLYCDEISSLIGDSAPRNISKVAGPALVEVGKKGAGMGVLLTLATQYPTLGALRDSQLKSQLAWRACFRLSEPQQGHYILPNMHKGVDPYRIPVDRQGSCYIDSQGVFRYALLRVVYFDHEKYRRGVVERYWQTRPQIDQMSLKWTDPELVELYQNRTRWTPEMLNRVAADEEVEGSRMVDLYDDSDDVDGDGKVDERDALLDEGIDPDDNGDECIIDAVNRFTVNDGNKAEIERRQWLAERELGVIPEATARDKMHEACRDSWPEGVTPRDLMGVCNRSEKTIHRWLREDEGHGLVTRLSYGRYSIGPSTQSRRPRR